MITPPDRIVQTALRAAGVAPCTKSRRGVVLFQPSIHDRVVGVGWNGLPQDAPCLETDACRETCARRCVHAEERAISAMLAKRGLGESRRITARGGEAPVAPGEVDAVHVKAVDGALVASGGPSCWVCARLVLDVGLAGFWLYQGGIWIRYTARDFYNETMKACGMPTLEGA